jgi:uncharacterized membrane protein YfcA
LDWIFIIAVGTLAGTLGGILGFGSSIVLLPVLVIVTGPHTAVPIIAVASVMGNLSRVVVWWREVDWHACAAYSVSAIPSAALGARTLLVMPPPAVETVLGCFFLLMIPTRRWLNTRGLRLGWPQLLLAGAVVGYLTGIVATTGPINAPLFLAHGLVKGAFLATEAASSLGVYLTKAAVFGAFGALPLHIALQGLLVGSSLMLGSVIAKRIVERFDAEGFRLLMDGLLLVCGATMLIAAWI